MIKIHGLDRDYEGNWETVLQAERWLDEKGIIKTLKKEGLYFQGLTLEKTDDLTQLLTYKTKLNKDVYMFVVDLNEREREREREFSSSTLLSNGAKRQSAIIILKEWISPEGGEDKDIEISI